jgi:hypothetical protein
LRTTAVFLAALLGGCAAGDGDRVLEVVHDACEPLHLVASSATDEERISLDDATAMWNELGQTRLTTAATRDARTLEVRFETAAPVFHGLYDDERGIVYVNHRLEDPRERAITIAHEVGHALGLWHVTGRDSVMNPANLSLEPNDDDAAELELLWGRCPASSAKR